MKLITWNLNHRTRPKLIPDLVPEAIGALGPDLMVLTEYVRGPSHDSFIARLFDLGMSNVLMSPEVQGENSLLIACRRRVVPGEIIAPPIAPSVPYNFLHVELPEDDLQVIGIRVPDYSRKPRIRRACWDWLGSVAGEVISSPTIIIGDLNSDPSYPKSHCGDRFAKLVEGGWQLALPADGASFWTPSNHAVRLDHAFISPHNRVISTRYVADISGLVLANKRKPSLPDHAALEIEIEPAMNYIYAACRRLLEMVQVLHRQGYERLRINPGMAPSGCYWRCEFLPSGMTSPDLPRRDNASSVETARYSSGQEKNYFGWMDAVSDSPDELAAKFIERFDDLSKASKGKDPAYVAWYSRMLDETAPDGIVYTYADYPLPENYFPVQNKPAIRIPFPPCASIPMAGDLS